MMKRKHIVQYMALALGILSVSVAFNSCTEEDLIGDGSKNGAESYTKLLNDSTYFIYNVDEIKKDLQSDSLLIYTYEISSPRNNDVKSIRYCRRNGYWDLDTIPENGGKDWIETHLEPGVVWGSPGFWFNPKNGRVYMENGEYRFHFGAGVFKSVALSGGHNAINISQLRKAAKYPGVIVLDTTKVSYIRYNGSERAVITSPGGWERPLFENDNWTDKNVYENADGKKAPFIANSTSNMVGGYTDNVELKVGESKVVEFEKQLYTQDYDIQLIVEKDDEIASDFRITEAYCSLAGIPCGVYLKTNRLDVDNTAKLTCYLTSDDKGQSQVVCKRSVKTLGITAGADSLDYESLNGAGIAHITIKGSYKGVGTYMFQALCNVKKAIKDAGLVEVREDGCYKTEKKTLPIRISNKITRSMLQNDSYYMTSKILVWKTK